MPPSKPRHTAYGRPLPTLAPVPRADVTDVPRNLALRTYIEDLLTQYYGDLLQADVHADMTIHLVVQHGRLQPHIDVSVTRHHRFVREDE